MSICIPQASGVPYLSGAPRFWTTTNATPATSFDAQIEDPRWTGCYAYGYGSGTGPLALLRAVWSSDGGDALLLSFHCRVDPLSDREDQLWIGLRTTLGQDMFVKIEWDSTGTAISAPQTSAAEVTLWKASVHGRSTAGSASGPVNVAVSLGATPAWLLANTRVWRAVVGVAPHINHPWAIHVRIPIKPSATSLTDPDGVPIDRNNFKMWIYGEQWLNAGAGGTPEDVVPFQWPVVQASGAFVAPYNADGNFEPPPSASWFDVSCGTACDGAGGVSIVHENFGTRNPPPATTNQYQIQRLALNTFFAKPRNQGPANVPPGGIGATFRMANWGSTIGADATWTTMPTTGDHTNRGTLAMGGALPGSTADIEVQWNSSAWEPAFMSGAKDPHQCIAVELDVRIGGGISLSKASDWWNMRFETNSVQSLKAEINAVGAAVPIDWVYLFLQTEGMTEGPYHWGSAADRVLKANPEDKVRHEAVAKLKSVLAHAGGEQGGLATQVAGVALSLDPDVVQMLLPSAKAHVFYRTGQRIQRNGQWRDVYSPATSFGVFGITNGVEGWRAHFENAVRVSDNLYALPIPRALRRARIIAKVQGMHKDEQPIRPPRVWKRPPGKPIDVDVLGHLMDRVDVLQRLQKRVFERFGLLDEVGRRSEALAKRLGSVPWGADAREVLHEIVRLSERARDGAKALDGHQRSLAAFEQQITVMDGFLDVLETFPEDEIERVVHEALGGREGSFSEVVDLSQRAYLVAYKSYAVLDTTVESLRGADRLLGEVDEGAGLLRRVGRDFDLRSPFDLEIDIPLIGKSVSLGDLFPRRVPLGGALTLARSMKRLGAIGEALRALAETLSAADAAQRDLADASADLATVDEAQVKRITKRLQRLHG